MEIKLTKETEIKSTLRQKIAFSNLLRKIANKEPWTLNEIMVISGYSENTAINPEQNLISKPGFQVLLEQIADDSVLAVIYSVLMGEDKRSALTAADMLLKLKDRYPASKSKVMGLFGNMDYKEDGEAKI